MDIGQSQFYNVTIPDDISWPYDRSQNWPVKFETSKRRYEKLKIKRKVSFSSSLKHQFFFNGKATQSKISTDRSLGALWALTSSWRPEGPGLLISPFAPFGSSGSVTPTQRASNSPTNDDLMKIMICLTWLIYAFGFWH